MGNIQNCPDCKSFAQAKYKDWALFQKAYTLFTQGKGHLPHVQNRPQELPLVPPGQARLPGL